MKSDLIDIYYKSDDVGIRTEKIKYTAEVTHKGLKDYRVFTAFDEDILENKVKSHVAKLEEKWEKIVLKQNISNHQIASQKEADIRTQSAIRSLEAVENILIHTLSIDDTINWEMLKDNTIFNEPNPENDINKYLNALSEPKSLIFQSYPTKPIENDFKPKLSFFDKLLKSNKDKKQQQSKKEFDQAMIKWSFDCSQIDSLNEERKKITNNK